MALVLDGKTLAKDIREQVKSEIENQNLDLGLGVILVGEDPASHLYVSLKKKACEEVGIRFDLKIYPEFISNEQLIEQIESWNEDPKITGILVQLPLPNHDTDKIINTIDPKKDVDGFHKDNVEKLLSGQDALAPAVGIGIIKLIEAAGQDLTDKTATIVSSELFGLPIKALLEKDGITATIVSHQDEDLSTKTKTADILVTAVGQPGLIKSNMVKPGAIVIDVGTTKVEGVLHGDADPEVEQVASAITPVPGGVGPMTVACLLTNIMKANAL